MLDLREIVFSSTGIADNVGSADGLTVGSLVGCLLWLWWVGWWVWWCFPVGQSGVAWWEMR